MSKYELTPDERERLWQEARRVWRMNPDGGPDWRAVVDFLAAEIGTPLAEKLEVAEARIAELEAAMPEPSVPKWEIGPCTYRNCETGRIICTDSQFTNHPLISESEKAGLIRHTLSGHLYFTKGEHPYDLMAPPAPAQDEGEVWWMAWDGPEREDSVFYRHPSEASSHWDHWQRVIVKPAPEDAP